MSNNKHVHAEILYSIEEGLMVHSDICSDELTDEFRSILHKALDEYLDNYDPDGAFAVGNFELSER